MLPDRVSNPGPLTYESGALPIALRGPVVILKKILYSFTKMPNKSINQLGTQHSVGIKSASFRHITPNQRWLNSDPKMQTVGKIVQLSMA